MTTVSPEARFDVARFTRALEECDAGSQLALYADDAEVRVVDRDRSTPDPQILHGKPAVRTWMTQRSSEVHSFRVVSVLCEDAELTIIAECRNQDGTLGVHACTGHLLGGLVVNQTVVLL